MNHEWFIYTYDRLRNLNVANYMAINKHIHDLHDQMKRLNNI